MCVSPFCTPTRGTLILLKECDGNTGIEAEKLSCSSAQLRSMSMPTGDLKLVATMNALRGCQLFGGLSAADLAQVAALATPRVLKKGDYLFHEWDAPRGIYVVQTGAITVHRTSPVGKQQVIHVLRGGESLGEGTLATETGYPHAGKIDFRETRVDPGTGTVRIHYRGWSETWDEDVPLSRIQLAHE